MTGITTMIVDDDVFTRVLLTKAIESLGHKVLGAFATAREAANFASKAKPQVAILDLDLGQGPTGIDLAQSLRKFDPTIGIVLLTSYDDPRLIRAKNLTLPEGTVYLGKKQVESDSVIQMAIATSMLQATLDEEPSRHSPALLAGKAAKLSDSQIEVMRLVSTGLTNAEIAKQRFLSEAAVGKSIARLVRQLSIVATAEQNQRVLIARAYFEAVGRATRNDG
jgi:two-component system nitrate/nitrite response regulator NarL